MKQKYTSTDLRNEILALEAECTRKEEHLKLAAGTIINNLKPANLIRNTFKSTIASPGFGKSMLKGALGLTAGFLSKKLFVMGSSNLVKKALGTVVELGVAKVVAGKADRIASSGLKMIAKRIK